MYEMVMLSLMLLPDYVIELLVELLTWNFCFVLRRNAQIHSLVIKYFGFNGIHKYYGEAYGVN